MSIQIKVKKLLQNYIFQKVGFKLEILGSSLRLPTPSKKSIDMTKIMWLITMTKIPKTILPMNPRPVGGGRVRGRKNRLRGW
jgi:hypothetical protein